MMAIVSGITTYFLHSNYATHHLKEELKKEKDQCGIQVAGVTQFNYFQYIQKAFLDVFMQFNYVWLQEL